MPTAARHGARPLSPLSMLRLLFWLALGAAIVWVLYRDIPIPGIASEEIVYATTPPVAGCEANGCTVVYALELANIGRSAQEVHVRLRGDAVAAALVPPTLRRATDAVATTATTERSGAESYAVGRLAPEERATLVFALHAPSHDTTLGWDRLLLGIDPVVGITRPGDVGALSADRVVNGLARVVHRLVRATAG